ncbi:hypothetical protein A8924_5688 [Saccharopolyspora erythraea NRRL 2338]|uniref:Uncharacterized protein n=2 Tax=Saccharopolyspora erythraea TaxID=1836 RepID=A4FKH0_SACEN|nr:hypothetical protein [Saccharopolyspora erythraea]EQD84249.1 hypothetical protein N599_21060 [Saccharopolyspora erythraea D]PFG98183.1 hypothetical protein A8924_5688 [Saccharopolyspora erythraea NRRL 2338]QRK88283.1 hypothetical protein JQX30_26860 [Saccharopolyspora erythraea]CAM04545.1 hypothetical protein SACE_5306 [Saccharopolyspora erythraea NRRL 2338]
MRVDEIEDKLGNYIRRHLLTEDPPEEFTYSTALFGDGVLDSLRLAMLINFIRNELAVEIPYEHVNRDDFHDVHTIAKMVVGLSSEAK